MISLINSIVTFFEYKFEFSSILTLLAYIYVDVASKIVLAFPGVGGSRAGEETEFYLIFLHPSYASLTFEQNLKTLEKHNL